MSGDLVRVTMSELDKGVEILVNAFWDDPLNLYFIPESQNRRKLFSDYLHVRLKFAVRYGEVYSTSPNFEGIAAWFPPRKSDLTYFRLLRVGFLGLIRLLGMKTVSRMNRVGSHGTKIRKQYLPEPHWHLFPIAVDPKHQKKGFASALMRPMLDKIQSQGLPCFLETLNEDYVSLYEHYGFEVIFKETLPGVELAIWGMVRSPNP
ncbi:MAG: GNAT family N-acetyltransferase [Candidatus Thorarchaeota archaeon]|jgi:ribosomal protein S18 acetylase RimI-like enzyme